MSEYLKLKEVDVLPRLPLEGMIDLTYRCNNNCRHCWISIPAESPEKDRELLFDEIIRIVDEARKMGCREWSISGGEPMLRSDFPEIFDYITMKSVAYALNTSGTLITPPIAKLMKKKGRKLVAIYGATAKVHDHITRTPGSFEAAMQGMVYLKEAGAGFIVQLIPMRDNYHEFNKMIKLAEFLSRYWRIGADWFYLSASGDPERNREIIRQRLDPNDVIELDKPDLLYEESMEKEESHKYLHKREDECLFTSCIASRKGFHIDPYGHMAFCSFIKDPDFRYDLRKGSFYEGWEKFIPSLSEQLKGGKEYFENCGSCELKGDCRWCPAYGYLEHRRFSAKIEYLCSVAKENKKFKDNWKKNHRRYYHIAGITIQVDSDIPITDNTFHPKFKLFQMNEPGEDVITVRHHFSLPDLNGQDLGKEVYRKAPWAIYRKNHSWLYLGISPEANNPEIHRVVVFNNDHTRVRIYNDQEDIFRKGGLHSLTLFPTDQILLARVLADKEGCYLHASGVNLAGKGLLFVGHSETGKSTIVNMLKGAAEILCDDRMIVRRWSDGFKIYGTWSYGEVPDVSPNAAPLRALLFLEQAPENRLIVIDNKREAINKLLTCLIKPFVTADWWDKMLSLVERIACEVPCYSLHFDKSGQVVELLKRFLK